MKKTLLYVTTIILCLTLIIPTSSVYADDLGINSYIVMDAETGYIMYENNADIPFAPASITKIMTMYLIFEALENGQISMDDMVTPSEQVRTVQSDVNTQIWLVPGREFPVRDLITAIAVPSASDAAIAMGEHIAGSELEFVAMMNDKARELELTNTTFVNPHGLDATGHVMSARDIAILSQRLIIDYPQVLEFSSMETYTPPSWHVNHRGEPYGLMNSTFRNLLRNNRGVISGLKTGYTAQSGYSMTTTATVNGRETIIVVMGAEDQGHRQTLIEDFIRNDIPKDYHTILVTEEKEVVDEISIPRSREASVSIGTLEDISLVAPRENEEITQDIKLKEGIRAPLKAEEQVGTITYYIGDQAVTSVPVYTLEEVSQANIFIRTIRGITGFFTGIFNWIRSTFF